MLVSDITPGERLWIIRRRAGKSCVETAAEHGIKTWLYQRWEKDGGSPPDVELDILEPYEHYALLRRRKGMRLRELAAHLGIAKETVSKMERGVKPWTHLIAYWEGKTYDGSVRLR
jgi:DNA-binding transcriptional regulator YiaG